MLTGSLYASDVVINAYKAMFAMMYGRYIDFNPKQLRKPALLVPVLVEIADVWGLLPSWNDKIYAVIFVGCYNGYELIASDPFRFLVSACTLQSKSIYREAMIHSVAINDKNDDFADWCNPDWFLEIGELQLHSRFKEHARDFRNRIASIENRFLHVSPSCCDKIEVARELGITIFREWATKGRRFRESSHDAIVKISQRDYDISTIITGSSLWATNKDTQTKFGHVHRAVENSFKEIERSIEGVFKGCRSAIARPRERIGEIWPKDSKDAVPYYANLHFPENYEYPWEKA